MNHKTTLPASTKAIVSFSTLALLVTCALAFAGPLNPPAGPVTGTLKTITEVEPRIAINAANTPGDGGSIFMITQPGSYYLTGNLTGVAGKFGIVIYASGVTLDLNGFSITGSAGAASGIVSAGPARTNITILNGSVRNWPICGIDLASGAAASNCRVKGIVASGNSVHGISTGPGSAVSDCSAYQNGFRGIAVAADGTVTACTASLNANGGISTANGGTITRCSAYQNTGTGISVADTGTIADCVVSASSLDGIACGSRCVVHANACGNNGNGAGGGGGAGILASGSHNQIEDNHCTGADRGVQVLSNANVIIRNTCYLNTTDWEFAPDNLYGPIIDRRAPGTPPIVGSNYNGALNTADANANFSI